MKGRENVRKKGIGKERKGKKKKGKRLLNKKQGYILYISIIFTPPPHLQDIIFFPRRAGRGEAPAGGGGVAKGENF